MIFETTLSKEEVLSRLHREIENSSWMVPFTVKNYEDNVKYGGTLSDKGFILTRKTRRVFQTSLIFNARFAESKEDIIDATVIRTKIFPNPFYLILELAVFLAGGYYLYKLFLMPSVGQNYMGTSILIIPVGLFLFTLATQVLFLFDELKYYRRFITDILEGR